MSLEIPSELRIGLIWEPAIAIAQDNLNIHSGNHDMVKKGSPWKAQGEDGLIAQNSKYGFVCYLGNRKIKACALGKPVLDFFSTVKQKSYDRFFPKPVSFSEF